MDFSSQVRLRPEAAARGSEPAVSCKVVENHAVALSAGHSSKITSPDLVKRATDFCFGVLLLVLFAPIIFLGWLLVRITSSGPGFYTQVRVGLNGRHFRIFKLRTMTHNCEANTGGARWSTKGDTRVTPAGRILRKTHIDELPQLFNVIAGDMSLVGPRPERPEFVTPLAAAIPGYLERLAVRPGVTGLAQIQLPPDSDMDSVRLKTALDRAYVENRGMWLDLRLLAGTAFYLVGFSYRSVRLIFGLPVADGRHLADIMAESVSETSTPVPVASARPGSDRHFHAESVVLLDPRA